MQCFKSHAYVVHACYYCDVDITGKDHQPTTAFCGLTRRHNSEISWTLVMYNFPSNVTAEDACSVLGTPHMRLLNVTTPIMVIGMLRIHKLSIAAC